jgi:histidinol dehydrogenase
MFPIVHYNDLPSNVEAALNRRSNYNSDQLNEAVRKAYEAVEQDGHNAIVDYSRKFDAPDFDEGCIFITDEFVENCIRSLSAELRLAIDVAVRNVTLFNSRIMMSLADWSFQLAKGHIVGEKIHALDSVLLWVPSRKAPLISTAIMLCAAARSAGVKSIILATPPNSNGLPEGNTVAAGYLAGATHFVCGNGLTIIAAAAMGKWSLGQVNAIYGPGPPAIAIAMQNSVKYGVASQAGLGPSDSLIIVDGHMGAQDARKVARDFLTELEHGEDSYAYVITKDSSAASMLHEEINSAVSKSFGKESQYLTQAKMGHGAIILFPNESRLIDFANGFAPEHLLVFANDSMIVKYTNSITKAAEVLVGKHTPFVAANYCVGIPAVLPTGGFARSFSGITARQFLRFVSFANLDEKALAGLYPTISALGLAEGLPNHVEGARVRVPKTKK